jgi:hypothetical protein
LFPLSFTSLARNRLVGELDFEQQQKYAEAGITGTRKINYPSWNLA